MCWGPDAPSPPGTAIGSMGCGFVWGSHGGPATGSRLSACPWLRSSKSVVMQGSALPATPLLLAPWPTKRSSVSHVVSL
jgi:hypothetical protein